MKISHLRIALIFISLCLSWFASAQSDTTAICTTCFVSVRLARLCGSLIEGKSTTMPEFSAYHVSPLSEDKPKVQSEFSRTY